LDEAFDSSNQAVEDAKADLDQYLQQVRKILKCKEACYVNVSRKFRYEIELPESVEVDEDDFICTSKVKGKHRY